MQRMRRRAALLAGGALAAGVAGCLHSEPDPATFAVTVEAPETAVVGEDVTVEWEVTNEGDLEDTQEVVSSAASEQQASEEVTLAGGERESGEFTVTPESEGALPVTVATDDDEATATVVIERTDG